MRFSVSAPKATEAPKTQSSPTVVATTTSSPLRQAAADGHPVAEQLLVKETMTAEELDDARSFEKYERLVDEGVEAGVMTV